MDNRGLPPQTSNFECLPGRAGGTPIGLAICLLTRRFTLGWRGSGAMRRLIQAGLGPRASPGVLRNK
jgi:hypothetical protein